MRKLLSALFLMGVSMALHAAVPQPQPDPMRPPPEWLAAQPAASEAPAQEPAARGSILVRRASQSTVWLGGQPIRVGQMIGDQKVVRIDRHRVVLEGGAVIELLGATRVIKNGDRK